MRIRTNRCRVSVGLGSRAAILLSRGAAVRRVSLRYFGSTTLASFGLAEVRIAPVGVGFDFVLARNHGHPFAKARKEFLGKTRQHAQLVNALKRTVALADAYNQRGASGADAGKAVQLLHAGAVEIEQRRRRVIPQGIILGQPRPRRPKRARQNRRQNPGTKIHHPSSAAYRVSVVPGAGRRRPRRGPFP